MTRTERPEHGASAVAEAPGGVIPGTEWPWKQSSLSCDVVLIEASGIVPAVYDWSPPRAYGWISRRSPENRSP